jgi:hypothetical protein
MNPITRIAAAASLALAIAAPASAQVWTLNNTSSGSTTEGLSYTLSASAVDADTWSFTLDISGINAAGVDTRGGRAFLEDLSFSAPSGFTGAALAGSTTLAGGLNAGGCNGAGASAFCFDGVHKAVSGSTMQVAFTIDSASFANYVPHLKIDWDGSANNYNLVSNDMVAGVPEPQTYALMLAGLAAVGFMARRRGPA